MYYSVGIAYLLWFCSGFGALGLHRFYLGKVFTGLLWMFTGGLGMIGSIYDFFTLTGQVREANILREMSSGAFRTREYSSANTGSERPWRDVDDGEARIVRDNEISDIPN